MSYSNNKDQAPYAFLNDPTHPQRKQFDAMHAFNDIMSGIGLAA